MGCSNLGEIQEDQLMYNYIIILFLFTACAKPASTITPIHKFAEVPSELLNKDALILIDIDNTILRPAFHYGSVEHLEHQIKQEASKSEFPKHQVKRKLLAKWEETQDTIDTKLIDEKVKSFIEQAMAADSTTLAFTARAPTIAYLSHKQLMRHDIFMSQLPDFSFSTTYKNQTFPDDDWCKRSVNIKACSEGKFEKIYHHSPAMFFKGILLAYDLNHKGKVFTDFFNQYKSYAIKRKLTVPSKIIFIDDKLYNVTSMQKAVSELGLEFHGYHLVDGFVFDPQKAEQEEVMFAK